MIIFLDIDGVLNGTHFFKSKKYKSKKAEHDYDMSNMINRYNLFWIGLLCKITKAKVVLSSTWKYGWNEDGSVRKDIEGHNMIKTNDLFRKYGIEIISITRKGALNLKLKWELNEEEIQKWCNERKLSGLEELHNRDFILKYCRGTQIADWLERNNYKGKYLIIDDEVSDILFYKELSKRIIQTSYYKKFGGFRFKHFIKALWSSL